MEQAYRSQAEQSVVRRLESIEAFCSQPDLCARQLHEVLAMLAFCCIVGAIAGVELVAALIRPAGAGGYVMLGLNALVVGLSAWVAGALVAKAFFYCALLCAPEALQDELQARLFSLRRKRHAGRRQDAELSTPVAPARGAKPTAGPRGPRPSSPKTLRPKSSLSAV